MPDEIEAINADVGVEFKLPNGKTVWGKPVPFPEARKLMAQLHAFDRTGDYENTLQPAVDRFAELTGIKDDEVMALCPDMTLGDLLQEIQRFFFRRRPRAPSSPPEPTTTPPSGA